MDVSELIRSANEVRFDVTGAGSTYRTWFRFTEERDLDLSGSPALTATLIPALASREDLAITGSVDGVLREGASTAQDVLLAWDREQHPRHPRFRPVEVTVDAEPAPASQTETDSQKGTACFFSGGLDSFYSVVKHRDELTALVFAVGFDVMLDDAELAGVVLPELRAAAAEIGLPLIEITTNLRGMGEHFRCGWGPDYHGAALATLANLLSPTFSKILIPSTRTYARLEPWGSHVLLDPLWSTRSLSIIHDGAEATRVDKIRAVADDAAAQRFLRVCHHNHGLGVYNCGECEKCVSTAVSAIAAGVLGKFETLPRPSWNAIASAEIPPGPAIHWRDSLRVLRTARRERTLQRAVDVALARNTLAWPLRRTRARVEWAARHPRQVYQRLSPTPS